MCMFQIILLPEPREQDCEDFPEDMLQDEQGETASAGSFSCYMAELQEA